MKIKTKKTVQKKSTSTLFPKKDKQKSNAKWRKQCVELAKILAKQRDRWVCQKPGCPNTRAGGKQIHGSHILPEGRYVQISAEPKNIIALCANCHTYGNNSWHENPLEQSWFHEKYPGLYQELKNLAEELSGAKIDYRSKYLELKKQINGLENDIS